MAFAPCVSTHPCESFGLVVRRENWTLPCTDQDFKALCGVARLRYSRAHLIFLSSQATAFLAEGCSLNCWCVQVAASVALLRCHGIFIFYLFYLGYADLGSGRVVFSTLPLVFYLFYLFYLGFACSSTGTGGAIALSQIHPRE
jgi:hypothetical protein